MQHQRLIRAHIHTNSEQYSVQDRSQRPLVGQQVPARRDQMVKALPLQPMRQRL